MMINSCIYYIFLSLFNGDSNVCVGAGALGAALANVGNVGKPESNSCCVDVEPFLNSTKQITNNNNIALFSF